MIIEIVARNGKGYSHCINKNLTAAYLSVIFARVIKKGNYYSNEDDYAPRTTTISL